MGCGSSNHVPRDFRPKPKATGIRAESHHNAGSTERLITSPRRRTLPHLPSASVSRARMQRLEEEATLEEDDGHDSGTGTGTSDCGLDGDSAEKSEEANSCRPSDSRPSSRQTDDESLEASSTDKALLRHLGDANEDNLERALAGVWTTDQLLFEDPSFPAAPSSLFFSSEPEDEGLQQVAWMRPHQLVEEPSLYVGGTSRRDVLQGVLGDCWLLSACAALAKRQSLLFKVLDPDQVLHGEGYRGFVTVRLWRYGEWVRVVIDDRLPVRDGRCIYARCPDPQEFWVAMIEKAFAKLHGCYEAIEGGMPLEAMVDLTGGLAERYDLRGPARHRQIYRYLRRSFASQAFITCSRNGDWRRANQTDLNGLVQGHAYTISGLYRVTLENPDDNNNSPGINCNKAVGDPRVHLIRVRNPWGDGNEWQGDWSDKDPRWALVPEPTKRAMGLHRMDDGEFWMEFFDDFCQQFEEVSICTIPFSLGSSGGGTMKVVFGQWSVDPDDWYLTTAGGSRNNLASFARNPQFLLKVFPADQLRGQRRDPVDKAGGAKYRQVLISLTQEHRRSLKYRMASLDQIGFCLYAVPDEMELDSPKVDEQFFAQNKDIGSSGPYINYRDVFSRFELQPGSCILVPATFEADRPGRFMLRIFDSLTDGCDIRELTTPL